jgi:superfamily II DNA/RNA helicase
VRSSPIVLERQDGDALVRGLDRAFTVARACGWPAKAVVFTEFRRTQDYLKRLLEARGYTTTCLSGDSGGPDRRQALVEEFRNRTQILLMTEAGAEGLNLQFCNLVVNYDLPWNPQRVEQRIGRSCPRKLPCPLVTAATETRGNGAVRKHTHESLRNRLLVTRVTEERRVTRDLAPGRRRSADDGCAARHRLERSIAEALVQRRVDKRTCASVQLHELSV